MRRTVVVVVGPDADELDAYTAAGAASLVVPVGGDGLALDDLPALVGRWGSRLVPMFSDAGAAASWRRVRSPGAAGQIGVRDGRGREPGGALDSTAPTWLVGQSVEADHPRPLDVLEQLRRAAWLRPDEVDVRVLLGVNMCYADPWKIVMKHQAGDLGKLSDAVPLWLSLPPGEVSVPDVVGRLPLIRGLAFAAGEELAEAHDLYPATPAQVRSVVHALEAMDA